MKKNEITFVGADVFARDKELFLGPFEADDGPFHDLPPEWTMAHVMHASGVFASVKQAKQNGWNKPVPAGFEETFIKKRGLTIFTLTRFDNGDVNND